MGKTISLEMACLSKKVNVDLFEEKLIETIEQTRFSEDSTLGGTVKEDGGDVKILGVLPCPVRIPLLEGFNKWMEYQQEELDLKVDYELQSANVGVDWIREKFEGDQEESLSDIYMSAGFDLFFDQDLIGKYKSRGIFEDLSGFERLNKDFQNQDLDFRDPMKQYTVMAGVPAVFLVNKDELGERDIPRTWEDLLKPEFENSVSLPLHDFDLFNAILLTIYKVHGEEGIKKLGRSLLRSMSPAEMVKSHIKKGQGDKPTITVMPYLFTQMVKETSPLKPVWPEDGAILSPIFLLTKKETKDKTKPIVDFFLSKEVGELLADKGGFPSVHPEVDNKFTEGRKFFWLGWDFINEHEDIGQLIKKCLDLFHGAKEEEAN